MSERAERHQEPHRDAVDGARALVDALYRDFLLRDLFGKVVPGAIVGLSLFMDRELTLAMVGRLEVSVPVALLLAGCAWVVGFAVQGIGEKTRLMIHHPDRYKVHTSRYPLRIRFKRYANLDDQRQVERYVIIKEAAGNGGTAFALAALVLAVRALVEPSPLFRSMGTLALILLVLVVLAAALLYTNRTHARKHYDFMEEANKLALGDSGGRSTGA